MNDRGTEQAWQEIAGRVEELLRQSLAGNLFYRMEYGSSRTVNPPDAAGDGNKEKQAQKP